MLENELIAFYFQMFTYHAPGFYITTEFGKLMVCLYLTHIMIVCKLIETYSS